MVARMISSIYCVALLTLVKADVPQPMALEALSRPMATDRRGIQPRLPQQFACTARLGDAHCLKRCHSDAWPPPPSRPPRAHFLTHHSCAFIRLQRRITTQDECCCTFARLITLSKHATDACRLSVTVRCESNIAPACSRCSGENLSSRRSAAAQHLRHAHLTLSRNHPHVDISDPSPKTARLTPSPQTALLTITSQAWEEEAANRDPDAIPEECRDTRRRLQAGVIPTSETVCHRNASDCRTHFPPACPPPAQLLPRP